MKPRVVTTPSLQRIDMTGAVLPCGTVLDYAYTRNRRAYWRVQCPDCPLTYIANGRTLRKATRSLCSCHKYDPNYLIGRTFERGTVIARDGVNNGDEACWTLQCSCPDKTLYRAATSDLVSRKTRSCGCLRREAVARANKTRRRRLDRLYADETLDTPAE